MPGCFRINAQDNVATLLDSGGGPLAVMGENPGHINALEEIQAGHKVALQAIDAGTPVVKFGVPIGVATCNIRAGEWVHLHNCASRFDERSRTLDQDSGAATDTRYE